MHPPLHTNPVSQQVDIRYPLRRDQFVPSLKGACRFSIRKQITDTSKIQQLPLPKKLKQYLMSCDYFICFS
nr:unnamed protein product [Meloidogyne enterolobii]